MYYYSYIDILVKTDFNDKWKKWSAPCKGNKVSAFLMPIAKNGTKMKNIDDYENLQKLTTLHVSYDTAGHKGMMYAIPICKVETVDQTFIVPVLPVAVIENITEMSQMGFIDSLQTQEMTLEFAKNLNSILENAAINGNACVYDENENLANKIARYCCAYDNVIQSKTLSYKCEDVGRGIAVAHFMAFEKQVLKNDNNNICFLLRKWMQDGKKFVPRLIQLVGKNIKSNLEDYDPERIKHVGTIYPLVKRAWQDEKRYQIPIYELQQNSSDDSYFLMINATPGLNVLNKMLADKILDEEHYNKSYESCVSELKCLIETYLVDDNVTLVEFDQTKNLASLLYEFTKNAVETCKV